MMYCLRLCVVRNDILLNMTLIIRSLNFISLPSFMIGSATVSEICELNQNKKKENSEIDYFQFKTFPRPNSTHIKHTIYHCMYSYVGTYGEVTILSLNWEIVVVVE